MKDRKSVKILLIGIGGYGINYLKELTEKDLGAVVIEGVCEVMPEVYEQFPVLKEKNIPVFQTPEEFYKKHMADLAVVSTPIHLHYSQIKTCLSKGSNVLCEKPVCTSVKGAKELIELERETGHFVAVGYQLNYSRDVLQMKKDILSGLFGRPVQMKALHAMKRGSAYYKRNSWAGKIMVNDCGVHDSPFNNACAHQFQVMTFLLGSKMDEAAMLSKVTGELYRANPGIENYDTASVKGETADGVPIYYYTTHNLERKSFGPVSEYRFELGTIYYGKDFGDGPVNEYVAVMNNGTSISYGRISKGERMQKLYDAIESTRDRNHPVCTISCAIPHLEAVEELSMLPIVPVSEGMIKWFGDEDDRYCCIKNAEEVLEQCYLNQLMPKESGAGWSK
ncbi:Gfo/Idh/MocA family oxidoreductase [Lacrimispora sp.]|uniref:Gfo/Idh/MocA family protein n=1 Tax=Lacrimispora sp. TaxID=2719234 RepID=UPI0032E496FC